MNLFLATFLAEVVDAVVSKTILIVGSNPIKSIFDAQNSLLIQIYSKKG
jgi:hypothetical protein